MEEGWKKSTEEIVGALLLALAEEALFKTLENRILKHNHNVDTERETLRQKLH